MKRHQAFKFELKPDGEQQRIMRRFAGSCRFVFNKALALQLERREAGEKHLGYVAMCKSLTEWKAKPEMLWLTETPSQALQQALKNLERAYKNFFENRADFPRFKKKGRFDSFRYPQGFKLDQGNSRLFLPKLGWIGYRKSRDVLGEAKNVTVSSSCGKWFVSIQTERECEPSVPQGSAVGIVMGNTHFAALSDGRVIEPLDSFKKHEQRLARYQRAMRRRVKFSNNWKKAKVKVQRINADIGNTRRDFLHKTSSQISQNHAMMVIEDVRVNTVSTPVKGPHARPGKTGTQKARFNHSILDQGWFEFRRQIEYKSAWRGGYLVPVVPDPASRACPGCSRVANCEDPSQVRFACVECGYVEHADVVGAINLLRAGHARLACGEPTPLGRSMKQEPTEADDALVA
ncbi:RNA-guided endonuclease InsQ/TnpB family protein [Noviherbaspirillum malthae]|uniref:RNA-guided endonuclease InsQ/TnpB family protein n=1 Tax=Noviherbaspirillum malthae TaxID=1260987 RepID=UPI00188E6FAB|nr:RNA-guided endonuclease TnpB family protein [Noviherbaspirillum malthae]